MGVVQQTIAYQSIGVTAPFSNGNNYVDIPKPTGLAVGDLMVAVVGGLSDGFNSLAAPAGWTTVQDGGQKLVSIAQDSQTVVFSKVAESADTTATDFRFTYADSTSSSLSGGYIVRIENPGSVQSNQDFTTITPTSTNSLILLVATSANDPSASNAGATFSGWSIATNDPTWTEVADAGVYDAGDDTAFSIGIAYAVRSEDTATGAASVTVSEVDATTQIMLVISPQTDGTVDDASNTINSVVPPVLLPTTVTTEVESPAVTANDNTKWTTILKT